MNLNLTWPEATIVAFDTETTGKYPLDAEICEIAAVKWQNGGIVDQFQTLIRPSRPMSDEVIAIHNITNEMVLTAPPIHEKIKAFHEFISGSLLLAHHAPFDLGFLTVEFERATLELPTSPVLCTCLLSLRTFPESPNHRLQTLIRHLNLEQGRAHRAFDDAMACLQLGIRCLERLGRDRSLMSLLDFQEVKLSWPDYSINELRKNEILSRIVMAVETRQQIQIVYNGGSRRGEPRTVQPIGLVRNSKQDFLVATDENDAQPKRFFLDKITKAIF